MVSQKPKKMYSDEFKKDAVRLLETSGKTKAEISRELGIPNGLLGRWQRRFKVNEETDTLELSEVEELRSELRSLKRELEITRMERDILKKRSESSRGITRNEIRCDRQGKIGISGASVVRVFRRFREWLLRLDEA